MPEAISTTAIVLGAFTKKAAESLISDVYGAIRDEVKYRASEYATQTRIETLYKRLKLIRFVKTIWQFEKEIDLASFYYPAKLIIKDKSVIITRLSDIPADGNILIQGTVGQGKSIFLRYLASKEAQLGKNIPLFIELRKIEDGSQFEQYVLTELATLGFDLNDRLIKKLCSSHKLTLFLDAFDETRVDQKLALIAALERMLLKYDGLRVVITARPQSGIQNVTSLRLFDLAPLTGEDYKGVISNFCPNAETARAIIKGVERQGHSIAPLLTTPLMVALLVFRYRVDHSIPENKLAFYSELFSTLLLRHDKSKPGFERPRASKLSDSALLEIFNSVAFLCRRNDVRAPKESDLIAFIKTSCASLSLAASPDAVLNDFVSITCLILREGADCRFIHTSLQEYHAALFIKSQTDAFAERFYTKCLTHWSFWKEELKFLAILDKYRFSKFFRIPEHMNILRIVQLDDPVEMSSNAKWFKDIFGDDTLMISLESRKPKGWSFVSFERYWSVSVLLPEGLPQIEGKKFWSCPIAESVLQKGVASGPKHTRVKFSDVLAEDPAHEGINCIAEALGRKLRSDLDRAIVFVKETEARLCYLE